MGKPSLTTASAFASCQKQRIKIMRGFKASWSAKLLIDGFFIWYNFIRPHMTFGHQPSENVGINGFDGWEGLIKRAISL